MKVVLARLYNPSLRIITPPLGIGYLLKALSEDETVFSVFLDCPLLKMRDDVFFQKIKRHRPDILGIQVFSIDYRRFSRAVPLLKQALPDTVLVAGGPHVTALPEDVLHDNPGLDFVVCGEGEIALPMLVQALRNGDLQSRLPEIPNLAYRWHGAVRKNPVTFVDVNKYGAPAWDLLDPHKYPPVQHGTFHKRGKVVPVITSRGCPYSCTFCAGALMTGKTIRLRHIASVVDEIAYLQKEYGFEEFIIEDENFTFYKDHVLRFAEAIRERSIQCSFSFPNGIRLDRLDEEIVKSLYQMGTYMVALGIEAISPNTLKRMKKNWTREQIREKVALLKTYDMIVHANFVLGFRDDTLDDIQQTIDFAMELDIDQACFGNYIPLPGTEDFDLLVGRNEICLNDINWSDYTSFYGQYPYHPKAISAKRLERIIRKATLKFYLRPRIFFRFLKRARNIAFLQSMVFRLGLLFKTPRGKYRHEGKI